MKRLLCYFKMVILFVIIAFPQTHTAQNNSISGIAYIQKLIETDSLQLAKNQLNKQLEYHKSLKNYDSLVSYIPLVGSFKLHNNDSKLAIANTSKFIDDLIAYNNPEISTKALIQLSNLYFDSRQYDKVYDIGLKALGYAKKMQPIDDVIISQIEYNLGTASLNLGQITQGKLHLYRSKEILETDKHKNELQQLYNTYNSIGRVHGSLVKIDSSTYYYKKAISILDKMDYTEINRDYWRAIVNNNISLNFQNTGQTNEAIVYITESINDFQKFIKVAKDESKKLRAKRFRLSTIDNLGTFYDGIGEFNRAIDLMSYSLNQKLGFLQEDDPNVVFSLVILGHTSLNAKEYDKASKYIDKALSYIRKNPSNYSFLHSFTLTLRASIYEAQNNFEGAKKLYEESEAMYLSSSDGTISSNYLDAIIEMSKFYSKNGDSKKALELAQKGYNHTQNVQFENNLVQFHHVQNMAEVYFNLKNYTEAQNYSEEALSFFNNQLQQSASRTDSIQNEFRKPRSLLINIKSKYNLEINKNEAFLKGILDKIEEGISILNRRKTIIKTLEDLNVLIAQNSELFSFAKQLRLDLYQKTKDEQYLSDLISLHESSLYNRIRSRLNVVNNLAFTDVPKDVSQREQNLKQLMGSALNNNDNTIDTFFKSESTWNTFLDSLKQNYPKYYNMRYASIEEPLGNIQANIPEQSTVIRYLFIEGKLYAFVIDASNRNIIELDYRNTKQLIKQLSEEQSDLSKVSGFYFQLYKTLWQPFEDMITTKNVVIIPDGELFNLSFETLTPLPINAFSELSTNSLLAKHNISYNYSLLLLDAYKKTVDYSNDFIAFAPEFNDKMKDDYSLSITDSIALDKTYLNLLPQPFSVDLARDFSKLFEGTSFINEKATKQVFKNEANEHKIIHIGTHAQSNNVSPELSRLIFAKDVTNDDNSLYTYEIYNQNLNSNLAILTACETGKPTYQSGEGMISLAHAFNYAGSESILTSLWKIDEQASTKIIGSFYKNIKKGWSQDKALQQAKLDYIALAEGRTIAPQYWAGLVLIGDTSPIDLNTSSHFIFWVLGVLVIFLIVFFVKREGTKT